MEAALVLTPRILLKNGPRGRQTFHFDGGRGLYRSRATLFRRRYYTMEFIEGRWALFHNDRHKRELTTYYHLGLGSTPFGYWTNGAECTNHITDPNPGHINFLYLLATMQSLTLVLHMTTHSFY